MERDYVEIMITVVIASYKYGHLAAHCIESVLSQNKKPERILFVDDGVGDCEHLPALYPEVEYVLRKQNLGTIDNFNDMLMRVNSEYVMFVGADNWLSSDAIQVLSKAITDIVTYDIIVTGELKREIPKRHPGECKWHFGDLYWSRYARHHGSVLYRTKLGQSIGYKPRVRDSAHSEEDWYLWNKMIEKGASFSHVKRALLFYRRHRENFLKYP